jgi:dynein heavy chain
MENTMKQIELIRD